MADKISFQAIKGHSWKKLTLWLSNHLKIETENAQATNLKNFNNLAKKLNLTCSRYSQLIHVTRERKL